MNNKKENLKLLLEFISKILDEDTNGWFHDELALLISKKIITEKDTTLKLSAVTIKEIGSIDRYIENGIIPIIDYSNITDLSVRQTLIRDCVEMGKCRFGKFGQNISFLDFCKYAFFQIEQLVNYYILQINNKQFTNSINYIKTYNTSARIDGKKSISSITFSDKLFAMYIQLGMNIELKSVLDKISYARNNSLHRSTESNIDMKLLYSQFIEAINTHKVNRSDINNNAIKEYNYYKFLEDRDYNLITESIIKLKDLIILNIKN